MNNTMKKIFVLLAVAVCAPAVAADVSDRADCATMQSRISELAAIEAPTDAQTAELTTLQSQYRSKCSISASGRRTNTAGRVSTASVVATAAAPVAAPVTTQTVVVTSQSVLNEYLADRQSLCDELKSDIDTFVSNGASDAEIEPLQNQYDADCNDLDKSKKAADDAETAAARVASGLCTDGSKPNKFGCCDGETFTDMGNLVFACCPEDGGECYPPINSGDAI